MAEIRQLMFHLGLGIEHGFDFAQHRVGAAEAAARWRADVDHELRGVGVRKQRQAHQRHQRSEEHTSELQSLMRISYAVFCLKKKKKHTHNKYTQIITRTNYEQKHHTNTNMRNTEDEP